MVKSLAAILDRANGTGVNAMSQHSGSRAAVCVAFIAAAIASTGCGSTRAVEDEAQVTQQLAFLRQIGLTRHDIEARLGTPSHYYEKADVVSYRLYFNHRGQLTTLPKGRSYHTLMLHYAPDGHLLRYSLIREPQ